MNNFIKNSGYFLLGVIVQGIILCLIDLVIYGFSFMEGVFFGIILSGIIPILLVALIMLTIAVVFKKFCFCSSKNFYMVVTPLIFWITAIIVGFVYMMKIVKLLGNNLSI